jgi:hypothetical protein
MVVHSSCVYVLAVVATLAGQPREEENGAGRDGCVGQMPRPSGDLEAVARKKGKESGPARVEGEVGHGWAESGVGPEFKRIFFEFQFILESGRCLEICIKRFRRNWT